MYSLILYGRRSVELQKWLHLSVSVQNASSFFNSFSSVTAARSSPRIGRKGKNFTVSYLVDSLGLPKKLAESISRKISFEDKGNPDSVLNLLRRHEFKDSQISSIVTDYPKLLIADTEKSLGPKLQFLQSRGASSSELTQIISTVPRILEKRGHKTISIYYDFVKETLLDKSSRFEKLCHSFPQGKLENKIRNVSVLRELGVPQRFLFSLLISDRQPVCGKEKIEESLKKVVEMGFDPTTSKFIEALNVIYRLSEKTIKEKVNIYKRLGFDVGYVWASFKKWPSFLSYSEKKITHTFETLKRCGLLKHEVLSLVKKHPAVLGYSLEKRTVPRCNVIKALMSKGLIGSKLPPMSSALSYTDQEFLKRYVRKHDDKQLVAELMAIYRAS